MIKNYFKTAFRNLLRYKGFSLINILGLSIGITGCLVIGLFVNDERQYDEFVKDGNNIYRFYTTREDNAGVTSTASVPPMFATSVQNYPEIAATTRLLMYSGKLLFEANEKKAYEDKGLIADSTFFKIFPLGFLKGDINTALNDPSSVVITGELAKKYFGTTDAIGKTIRIERSDLIVSGVLDKVPEHFHLDVDFIMPISSVGIPAERMKSWNWQQFFTYMKVKSGTDIARLQSKFQDVVKKEAEPQTKKSGFSYVPFMQSLKDIHLQSADFIYDNAKRGNAAYIKGLTIIAIFVLLIACFNFINLATARSFRRAKEIGVRKVIGAEKRQLISQFTGETILLACIAIVIATSVTLLLLPALNRFTGKSISFEPFTDPLLALSLLAGAVVIGIFAGIYPALVMSGFQPIRVLKGLKPAGNSMGSSALLRKGLVIVQFTLSALLIVCTTIVYRQLNFLHQKDLGFSKEQIVYFAAQGDIGKKPEEFKTDLLRSPGVISATAGYGLPGDVLAGDGIIVPGKDGDKEETTNLFIVDYDYIKTLGLQLITGRDFSREHSTDADEAFIINETAVKELGFGTPENALGKQLGWNKWRPDSLHPIKRGQVIGVVKDFHYKSLHEKVSKAVLLIYPRYVAKVAVKVRANDLDKTMAYIKSVWNKFSPEYPLDYNFLDENFDKMYKSEEKLSGLLWIFTAMAIFVGCMGLFGLAAFNAEQKVKEIGIRKVLGANTRNIVTLLSKNFVVLIIISLLIASPVAWWAMNKWLEDFAYKVNISWWVFAAAGIAALLIAMLTISFQAIKAAVANPVKSLRTE